MNLILKFLNPSGPINEIAVRNNLSNRNTAKGMFKGIFTGEYLPTMLNIGKMITSTYKGWIDPEQENPYLQAGVPEVLPGKVNIPAATGLSVRTVKPLKLFNKPMNPAEKLAALDFIKETGIKVNTLLPIGRPSYKGMFGEDVRLPKIKVEPTKPEIKPIPKKTAALRSAQYSKEKLEDRGNRIGRNKRDAFNEARAYAEGDARKVHVAGRAYNKTDNALLNEIVNKIHLYPKSVLSKVNRLRINIEKTSTKEGKTLAKRLLREYLRIIRDLNGIYKKGGKAFVKGVNVLDSNPKLYKYIKKAKFGTFLKNNSLELFSITSNLYNIFDTNNKITDYLNSNNKQIALGKEAILNNVGDVSSEVLKRLTKLKEQNPDLHFGDLDIQMLTNLVILERRALNLLEADMFELLEKFKLLEAMNALQGTTSDSYGNLIEALGGISGNILNDKKLFSSNNSNSNFNTKIEPKLTTNNYTTNNSTDFFKNGIMGGYTNSPFYLYSKNKPRLD